MSEKIIKTESDGTHVKYFTDKGREMKFDLSTPEGKAQLQGLVTSMGVASIQFAEELVGFTLPAGL